MSWKVQNFYTIYVKIQYKVTRVDPPQEGSWYHYISKNFGQYHHITKKNRQYQNIINVCNYIHLPTISPYHHHNHGNVMLDITISPHFSAIIMYHQDVKYHHIIFLGEYLTFIRYWDVRYHDLSSRDKWYSARRSRVRISSGRDWMNHDTRPLNRG